MPNQNPLTDQHLTAINAALRNIHDARAVAAKAKAAGMDTTQHETFADQMEQSLNAYKVQFFGLKNTPQKVSKE